jgi:hypothetical protein
VRLIGNPFPRCWHARTLKQCWDMPARHTCFVRCRLTDAGGHKWREVGRAQVQRKMAGGGNLSASMAGKVGSPPSPAPHSGSPQLEKTPGPIFAVGEGRRRRFRPVAPAGRTMQICLTDSIFSADGTIFPRILLRWHHGAGFKQRCMSISNRRGKTRARKTNRLFGARGRPREPPADARKRSGR